jgi:hypothetical protein
MGYSFKNYGLPDVDVQTFGIYSAHSVNVVTGVECSELSGGLPSEWLLGLNRNQGSD